MCVINIRYTYSFIGVIYYKSHIFLEIPEFLTYKTYAYMHSSVYAGIYTGNLYILSSICHAIFLTIRYVVIYPADSYINAVACPEKLEGGGGRGGVITK